MTFYSQFLKAGFIFSVILLIWENNKMSEIIHSYVPLLASNYHFGKKPELCTLTYF